MREGKSVMNRVFAFKSGNVEKLVTTFSKVPANFVTFNWPTLHSLISSLIGNLGSHRRRSKVTA
jgi:hypothetical protein